ncbi:MAG: MBL fold metallo-hydrolase [Bacteroidales bacterium]|nr:MBL fold metallo-hydrolase [Bacteroidales bacterium]
MLRVKQFRFSLFGVNTYLAIDEATCDAAVIDPAMADPDEQKRFDDYVAANHLKLIEVINTHLHLDHCFGENYVVDKYGVPVAANISDAPLAADIDAQRAKFGLPPSGDKIHIDVELKDGDIIKIGESELLVIHVPGHSPGGIALYYPQGNLLFSGDSLFQGSIGRTDLQGGDYNQLISSLKNKILTLPDRTTVLPGHEGPTTIGAEKTHNPYLR